MHANQRNSLCKSAQFQKITFGAPAVNAEMGQPRIDRGVSANEPAIPVQNAHEPDPDVEMHVNGDLPDLEIEAEDNEEAPTPIAVWQELVEQDGLIGVT